MGTPARKFDRFLISRTSSLLLSVALLVGSLSVLTVFPDQVAYAAPPPDHVRLSGSVPAQIAAAQILGHHKSTVGEQLTIELVLAMNHQDRMNMLMRDLYNPHSPQYRHWLPTGAFDTLFGPTQAQLTAARHFLTQSGLTILQGNTSTFLLEARGSLDQMEAAFHVSIKDYRSSDGQTFFANDTDVQIPTSLSGTIVAVLGLTNVAALRPLYQRSSRLKPHYGGGPGGTGLTPSQIAGIYGATPVYRHLHEAGQGVTFGLVELSSYTPSDISVYENTFFPGLPHVPLVNILVNGGATDHKDAGEVELDIEMQIALAPLARAILIYEAANTLSNEVDVEFQIASANAADAVSTSFGICEPLIPDTLKTAENIAFTKMALQGQSFFAASGDQGAFDCAGANPSDLTLQVDDPASQRLVTAVGGTSFAGTFDPGTNPNPTHPGKAKEHVWNEGCSPSGCTGRGVGASGGGVSRFWAKPRYQAGPGVVESGLSKSGAYCGQPTSVLCREVPDVSLNADPLSGYAVFCTDPVGCPSRGWQQIGGTSAAAPLWSAVAVLMDSFKHARVGLFSFFLYHSADPDGYMEEFHDITIGNNGFYPADSSYDMSTGIGTPYIYNFVINV